MTPRMVLAGEVIVWHHPLGGRKHWTELFGHHEFVVWVAVIGDAGRQLGVCIHLETKRSGGGSSMSCWHRATHASHRKTQDCLRGSVESLRWHLEVQDPQLGNHWTGPKEQRTVILGEGSGQ